MTTRRFLTVVNPRGGTRRGLAILEQVRPVFVESGIQLDVRVTEHSGHARQIIQALDVQNYSALCVIGGDGTIHEVVNGLMQRGQPELIPLGIIPAGSGNTMHQHFGFTDPVEAARRILSERTRFLDVARVTTDGQVIYCVDVVGWGGVADINCMAERLRLIGPTRYAAAALWQIVRARRRRAKLVLDGMKIADDFLFAIGCNTKFTGKGMKLAPHADIGDGKFDFVVVRRASRLQLLKLFKRVFDGSHTSLSCVEYHQVRSFSIESEGHDILDLDGEISGTTPVSVQVLQGMLRVFV